MSTNSKKRRIALETPEEKSRKRAKIVPASPAPSHTSCSEKDQAGSSSSSSSQTRTKSAVVEQKKQKMKSQEKTESAKKRVKIRKLAPPKPFPTVAASVSATGPRSAHKEGKNFICLTRKTSLGAYMRRCKNLIMNDGYKILHLHAAGAAIPLLMQLSCALPSILPFPKDEIHTEIATGTVEVQDEVIPDDEDEDITYRTRGKSTLYVVIRIGDGQFEKDGSKPIVTDEGSKPKKPKSRPKKTAGNKAVLVFEEPEQEQEDI